MRKTKEMQKELSQEIAKFSAVPLPRRELIKKYVGRGSDLNYLGLSIPKIRSVMKKKLTVFKLPMNQQYKIFETNWFEAQTYEEKALSIFWLESLSEKDFLKYSKKILAWAHIIDNWAHSDGLCALYAKAFEKQPKQILPIYKKWNTHKNPWLRRCSMVGLFYYSRLRKIHPSWALSKSMVVPHLAAPEYYVQKGVGWTLREMYNVYPAETIKFLNDHLIKISSIAWVAASEKLDRNVKTKLLEKRKLARKKSVIY